MKKYIIIVGLLAIAVIASSFDIKHNELNMNVEEADLCKQCICNGILYCEGVQICRFGYKYTCTYEVNSNDKWWWAETTIQCN